jgi:hypothetical protein
MKRFVLVALCFCFLSLPVQGQSYFDLMRTFNEKVGAVTDPFYKAQLDYLVGCLENGALSGLPFSVLEKYIYAYLCHLEYLASHTEASQHLDEGRQIVADLTWDWFLISAFMDPAPDPDPPPDPPEPCKVQIWVHFGNELGRMVNGKFQTREHRHKMIAKGSPPDGMYVWSLEPAGVENTAFFSKDERAMVSTYRKGELKVKVVYTVGDQTCEDMLNFTFR